MSTGIHSSFASGSTPTLGQNAWWAYLLWIPATALAGFAIAAIFAGLLHWPRSVFLIPYATLIGLFTYAFNPLTAILSHIAMHVAGVLHGPASVIQLPPHY